MIAVGNDHAALSLKKIILGYLDARGIAYRDFGTNGTASVDYPDFAAKVCKSIIAGECDGGVLICGTGMGMAMAANKYSGIRAAPCGDAYSARMTRAHNDANVLCLGERVIGAGLAIDVLEVFLSTPFEGGRHSIRVKKIDGI